MMPGISLNWRRTSSTTRPPATLTAFIASEAKMKGSIAPMKRPSSTGVVRESKLTVRPPRRFRSSMNVAKSTTAARPAEAIA